MGTRKEIITVQRKKYQKAGKKEKGQILDSICQSTGLSRSRAKHVLTKFKQTARVQKRKPGRSRRYGEDVRQALEKIWAMMDFASSRRLVAGMDDMLTALSAHGELSLSDDVTDKLKRISASTTDRLLKKVKTKSPHKGKSTTKPGTLLKKDIPLRMGDEWDDAEPGFVEIDLVAHCGETTAGDYVNTLTVTDISSGWTETVAVLNKAQLHTFNGLKTVGARQPFPYKGIDSDNGSEFINAHLLNWCKQNKIVFTRSRPYKKNDNCHVEQKNWHMVRRNIGYARYEGQSATDALNDYYALLRLHSNFFLPQSKLISKERIGAKIHKRYDTPKTPFRRLLDSDMIPSEQKLALTNTFNSLNPKALLIEMQGLIDKLKEHSQKRN
jgi:hypothetical protein